MESLAFQEVVKFCHIFITEQPSIIKFQVLTDIMEESFTDIKMSCSTKKNLHRNVEKTFQTDLTFVNHNGTLYMYANTLTFDKLVIEFIKKLNEIGESNIEVVSKSIRQEIQQMKDELPWPPQPEHLAPDQFKIPHKLDIFLNVLYSGTVQAQDLSSRGSRYKLSLGQDIVYTVSNGEVKTPKSVLYPCTIKTLTNCTELINVTNRLGHGVCYSNLMELFTENAFKIQDQQFQSSCILPLDVKNEAFTIYVADNIDRQEETLTGKIALVDFLF